MFDISCTALLRMDGARSRKHGARRANKKVVQLTWGELLGLNTPRSSWSSPTLGGPHRLVESDQPAPPRRIHVLHLGACIRVLPAGIKDL
jgi:hypothetical protein